MDTADGEGRSARRIGGYPIPTTPLLPAPRGGARLSIDLRALGFVGRVSDDALAEINAAERRARGVISTAHRFWFRGNDQ